MNTTTQAFAATQHEATAEQQEQVFAQIKLTSNQIAEMVEDYFLAMVEATGELTLTPFTVTFNQSENSSFPQVQPCEVHPAQPDHGKSFESVITDFVQAEMDRRIERKQSVKIAPYLIRIDVDEMGWTPSVKLLNS